jgi:hypothetical protein
MHQLTLGLILALALAGMAVLTIGMQADSVQGQAAKAQPWPAPMIGLERTH